MRRTSSPLPYNRTFLSALSAAHDIIYLGTFYVTFIRHHVFVFLLKINVDNHQIHPFCKIHNHRSFLFLVPAPYHHITSSSLMFPSPTCLFRSAPKTIFSCFDTLSINPSKSCQKSCFSSMLLPTCGAYALTMFSIDPFTSSFMAINLFDILFTSKTISSKSSLCTIPIHFFFPQLHCRIVCSHLQCSSLYSLFTLFPVGAVYLLYIPLLHQVCQLSPPYSHCSYIMSVHLLFNSVRCLFTRLPPLFLLLFSAVA